MSGKSRDLTKPFTQDIFDQNNRTIDWVSAIKVVSKIENPVNKGILKGSHLFPYRQVTPKNIFPELCLLLDPVE
jgi:hypothetical protein